MCADQVPKPVTRRRARQSPAGTLASGPPDVREPPARRPGSRWPPRARRATPPVEAAGRAGGRITGSERREPILERPPGPRTSRRLPLVPASGGTHGRRLEPRGQGRDPVAVRRGPDGHRQQRPDQDRDTRGVRRAACPARRPPGLMAGPAAQASNTPTTAPGVEAPTRSPRHVPSAQLTSVAQRARSLPDPAPPDCAESAVLGDAAPCVAAATRTHPGYAGPRAAAATADRTVSTDTPRPEVAPMARAMASSGLRQRTPAAESTRRVALASVGARPAPATSRTTLVGNSESTAIRAGSRSWSRSAAWTSGTPASPMRHASRPSRRPGRPRPLPDPGTRATGRRAGRAPGHGRGCRGSCAGTPDPSVRPAAPATRPHRPGCPALAPAPVRRTRPSRVPVAVDHQRPRASDARWYRRRRPRRPSRPRAARRASGSSSAAANRQRCRSSGKMLALVARDELRVGRLVEHRASELHAVLLAEALDLAVPEHRQPGQRRQQRGHADVLVARPELVDGRPLVGVVHEVDVAAEDPGVEADRLADDARGSRRCPRRAACA